MRIDIAIPFLITVYSKVYCIISNNSGTRKSRSINRTKNYSYFRNFIYYIPPRWISKFYIALLFLSNLMLLKNLLTISMFSDVHLNVGGILKSQKSKLSDILSSVLLNLFRNCKALSPFKPV